MEQKNQKQGPYIVHFDAQIENETFENWYISQKVFLEEKLRDHGSILFKNTTISNIDDFNRVLDSIVVDLKPYIDGFSPRSKLQSNIYTSTEYDKNQYITLHNELSYSSNWPTKLFFCCIIPSHTGGETPISDCREILKNIPEHITKEFKEKGVRYIRNLHGGVGAGPSWQETFETENKDEVVQFCSENDIEFEWRSGNMLRLIQNRPATIVHPLSNEEVWFNQVDQFHPSQLPSEIYEMLMMINNNQAENLPMYGCFGDGSQIPEEYLTEIRKTADSLRVLNKWGKGDLLVVDNILACHGRMPYEGDRQILVAME